MVERNLGIQPLDGLMVRLGLANSDLVKASPRQLTHKMVHRGRIGRRLTLKTQTIILEALNTAKPGNDFTLRDIFSY